MKSGLKSSLAELVNNRLHRSNERLNYWRSEIKDCRISDESSLSEAPI